MERRSFLAALAALAANDATAQRPEVETYWAEVPPRATLWGHAVFLSDEPVELTVAAGKTIQKMRGRFGGERMKECSWRNASDTQQRVGIRAVALAGDRELPAGPVHYTFENHVFAAFGQRVTPQNHADRRGGYPSEAVFVGFIVFDE